MQEKKIIFVDFYGILSTTRFWFSADNPSHKLYKYREDIGDFLFSDDRTLVNAWMRGEYTSEEIHQIIAEKFPVYFDELFNIFKEDCARIELSQKILKRLKEMPESYLRIMVTDNMDSFDRFILPANPILGETFHEINNSFYAKKLKADKNGEWFLDILKNYDVPIESCVLIDDSLKNCETFQNLGGKYYNTKTEEEVLEALEEIKNPKS